MDSCEFSDCKMDIVLKNIYSSCDPDNSNLVPVSKLIEFVTPYMLEHLPALESLRYSLDPDNKNGCVTSETFYQVMNEWAKNIASSSEEDSDFNKTSSAFETQEQLPYNQSTPRTSFRQKLLSCECLLNLSNVSGYSLSTSNETKENSRVGQEKTVLEEEVQRLEHQLKIISHELSSVKLQLAEADERNEILQADLDRFKTRLQSEQQVIEHLQCDKRYNDELREELNLTQKQVNDLQKKLLQFERDNIILNDIIKKNEEENTILEERCDDLLKREQEAKKEIISIATELGLKDQEITTIMTINEELKGKLKQERDIIDELKNEIELLQHQKNNLEKTVRGNLSTRRDSLLSQYKSCLADSSSLADLDQESDEECYFKVQGLDYKNAAQDSLHAEITQAVQVEKSLHYSLLSYERNEKLMELETSNNFIIQSYKDKINQLKLKNDSVQRKLNATNQDNDRLQRQVEEIKDKMRTLQEDITNLTTEKKKIECELKEIEEAKSKVESELKELQTKVVELTDQNNNLSQKEKSTSSTLADLEVNFLQLKQEFTILQMENIAKEKELCSKINCEVAYKEIQTELCKSNNVIENLTESNKELRNHVDKLTYSNEQLKQSLERARGELREDEDKSREMMSINQNITLTTTQVQVHLARKTVIINKLAELNKRFENTIEKLEKDLEKKISEITKLQESLEADERIKNDMWCNNKHLKWQLDEQIEKNEKISNELKELKEKQEAEFIQLLSNFNNEVEKNSKLCEQIYTLKNDLSSSINKHNEEVNKNQNLYKQVSTLKLDIESVRKSQNEYKENINKKLNEYENLIKILEEKLQKTENENNILRKKSSISFDIDFSSSETAKNSRISFEKQKLAIDRLKEKLEHTEEQLQQETIKREILEQSLKEKHVIHDKYTKVLLNFEQSQCTNLLENKKLHITISELSDKIKVQEERYSQIEEMLRESNEKSSLKLLRLEQQSQHLSNELKNKEFIIKNAFLEVETYKNLYKNADQKAQELSKTISDCLLESNKNREEIELLNTKLADKENKILSMSSKITEKEDELSNILRELTEKTSMNATLEKENKYLQEMLSKSDDYKEKELLDIEQRIRNSHKQLQSCEMELKLVEKNLSDSKKKYDIICKEVTKYENLITISRAELSRASNLVFNKWGEILEQETVYKDLMLLMEETKTLEKEGEMCSLDNKIKIAVLLLQLLSTKAPIPMEGIDYGISSILESKPNSNQYSQSDVKMIKKFTLRPSRLLVSRPVSPDSPSVDIAGTNADAPQEINVGTPKENYLDQSPDSHFCEACPYTPDNRYETASEEISFRKDIDFVCEESFPNPLDTFLEKLGLNESSPKKTFTKKETEEHFATFAIQIALNSKDIKDRLQKQKERCTQQHDKFLSLIKDVSNRLRDHKCIGAADPISPVFVLLEDIKFLLNDLIQSAEQFGMLACESRMMKCWNLVTNYVAFLKQDVANLCIIEPIRYKSDSKTGVISSLGSNFRKRLQGFGKKDEVRHNSTASTSKITVAHKSRYGGYTTVKHAIIFLFVVIFLILMLCISIHWQCRMTAHENQVCVLDDFIKKIQIGNPPY